MEDYPKYLVSGCDIDGIARGKILSKKKFASVRESGFAWDMHDELYEPQVPMMKNQTGFADIVAKIDLSTKRIDPLTNVPHYLVDFYDPQSGKPIPMCCRSLLKKVIGKYTDIIPQTGMELEFFNFKETPDSLTAKEGSNLIPLTSGMFGYSLMRPAVNQAFFDQVYDKCKSFDIPLECFHTETGPGVFEAAIEYSDTLKLADRAQLFKMLTKKIGLEHGIAPCFMAKPHNNLPGCSGHLHFSLRDKNGKNLFYNESDSQKVSDTLRYFIAGVMNGLPSVMALFAPTINSYKRLNAAYWAPVTVSYGFEDRGSAIRIITPPICSPMATRIEVRVPGADVNAYLACAGVLACGYDGIDKKMELPELVDPTTCPALPRTLHDAVNKMDEKGSVCRSLLGDEFVDHFVATRQHELRLWNQTVTSWEVKRYIETV